MLTLSFHEEYHFLRELVFIKNIERKCFRFIETEI